MDDQHKPEWIKVDEWDFVEYVDSLLRSQEAVDLEFKTARAGFPNSVWETYSSFANTDGGTIVLGIKEKNGALFVEGLLPEQIVSYRKISFADLCSESISFTTSCIFNKKSLEWTYL